MILTLFPKPKIFIAAILLVACMRYTYAQDLGQIGKEKKPVKITGNVTVQQILYGVSGIENRRPPYNYFLAGNLNVSLYGWSVPINYTLSNQQSGFQQPFNQFGMTPYYKWIKLFGGYASMTFSPYTLNGHIFLGGGVQLTPGIFRFSAMYGRLYRAVEEDTTNTSVVPYYQRMGFGMKIGVSKGANFADINIFKGSDDPASLQRTPTRLPIKPAENLVVSLLFGKSIIKNLNISGEFAISGYTADLLSPLSQEKTAGINAILAAMPSRTSTSYHHAFKTQLLYSGKGYSIGVGYERIDPGYKTMGAYYFNDDLENITTYGSKSFLEGKLNLAANIGIQHNNLRDDKLSAMNRYIAAFNGSFAPSPRWNFTAGFSNFQSYTRMRTQFDRINQLTPFDYIDTLNFIQISRSINTNISFIPGDLQNKERRDNITLSFNWQTSGDARNEKEIKPSAAFYNINISYSRMLIPKSMNITFAFNSNVNEMDKYMSVLFGPSLTVSKSYFNKKLKINASTAWTNSRAGSRGNSDVFNLRLGGTYTFKTKHNFNINLSTIYRQSYGDKEGKLSNSFTEYTCTMGYSYSF